MISIRFTTRGVTKRTIGGGKDTCRWSTNEQRWVRASDAIPRLLMAAPHLARA